MLRVFQTYHFFVLAFFMGIPAWWLVFQNPQHVKETAWIAVFAIPFAFTERFFVPGYWNPVFLWSFFQWTGAGVEDLLFVIHLAWITVYSPLLIFRRDWGERKVLWEVGVVIRVIGLMLATLGSFGVAIRIGLNPLIGASVGMVFGMVFMGCAVPRLSGDMGRGALAGGSVYFFTCLIYGAVYPDDFTVIWRTAGLSHRFLLGVPLEEVVYGVLAGGIGGSFIPFLQGVPTRSRSLDGQSPTANRNPDAPKPNPGIQTTRFIRSLHLELNR